ncbi:MAG: hypothetical protein ACI87O_001821 [Planctomycetota bacterium]
MNLLHCILFICSSLQGTDGQPCAATPSVGPFTVEVVEMTYQKLPEQPVVEAELPARSIMLQSEFFEFVDGVDGEEFLPTAIVALRHYARGEMDILEWDTVFEGGQLLLSDHQVLYEERKPKGEHLKSIWRERALGQGAAHTVIAESVESGEDAGDWHVLRYGLQSQAHGSASHLDAAQSPVKTRLGLLQQARAGHVPNGSLALWNGELGTWETGQVRTIDLNMGASLEWLQPGLNTPRAVIWRSIESSSCLAFELNGPHCMGFKTRQGGPWARPMHPDVWQRLDYKWRREAPVQDPGAKARAIQATAPFFDKKEHTVPTWHTM